MSVWILVLILQNPTTYQRAYFSTTVSMQEFNSHQSCINAGNAIIKANQSLSDTAIRSMCVPK